MAQQTEAQCAAQRRNYSIFLIKGSQCHTHFLSQTISQETLDKFNAVCTEMLKELNYNPKDHCNGTA